MSRTYKDKPYKLRIESWYKDRVRYWEGCNYISYQLPTTKTKKRKEVDTEDHWMTTPGWWTRLVMNKPQRRAQHLQEKAVLKAADLEDVDFPDIGRKPHVYYW